jgi:putative membrane protein
MRLTSLTSCAVVVLAGWTPVSAGHPHRQASAFQRAPAVPGVGSAAHAFIEDVAAASVAEVRLGEMAADKAANPEIKDFGQLMIVDHSRANSELSQVAGSLGVRFPTELDPGHRSIGERLSRLDGMDFDRAYVDLMVERHADFIGRLRARVASRRNSTQGADDGRSTVVGTSGSAAEQALGQWASKTLPTEERHLERARELQRKVR